MKHSRSSGEKSAHPIVGRKIKIAIVGCGRIFLKHLEAVKENHADLELIAVCDTDPQRLESAKALTGCAGFHSLKNLLENCQVDIVCLCTPSGLHPEQTIELARFGKHVITEKPMATKWNEGKAMVQACDAAGVYLFVVKQNRTNETIQKLKNAVKSKRFGRIYMVVVNVLWSRPEAYYQADDWRGTWEFDGGAFMNQASHYVDLLDWLIGPVESVQAYSGTLARNIEVEDTGTAILRWRSGAMGSINVTMLTHDKNLEGSITIIGEEGTVRIGGVALNEINHWDFKNKAQDDATATESNYSTESVYGFGHSRYLKNVISVLRGESRPETDGREGLRSLELLIAIYRAAKEGKRIALPLEN